MRVCIYGASDDLIEVDGDLREEFYALKVGEDDESVYVALSTGTLIKVTYDGNWTLRVVEHGDASVTKHEAVDLGGTVPEGFEEVVSDYSDAVVVEADSIEWVLLGSDLVTPDTSIPRHE